jgi:PKD repeat protein
LSPSQPAFGAEPAPRAFAPVQNGPSQQLETVLPYAQDRIFIKFTPEGMSRARIAVGGEKGTGARGPSTGLPSLDAALTEVGVRRIQRRHGSLQNRDLAGRLGLDRWFRLDLPPGTDIAALTARLAADTDLEAAEPDWRAFPAVTPDDPLLADHWGHRNFGQLPAFSWGGSWSHTGAPVGTPGFDAGAHDAWGAAQGFGDPDVVIAILDSGVDTSHPDLRLTPGYDFGDDDDDPDDDSARPGHGTACAGVAAAVADNHLGIAGIAGGCSVMPLKVADSTGAIMFSYVIDALYHAADNGADVVSMSFGIAGLDSYGAADDALAYAHDSGVTLLAAVGNENSSALNYPANNAHVIAVGAASPCGDRKRSSSNAADVNPGNNTDPNGYTCDGERWWGSNYGGTVRDDRMAVDILAPTILPTTDIAGSGGYRSGDYEPFFNGTSCSAPYAAGVAALVISANPGWTPAQVRARLVETATDVVNVESGSGWDRYSGYGMVNAGLALQPVPVAPTAAFAGTSTTGCGPLEVAFTDLSTGDISGWSWDFGDAAIDSVQHPVHVYEQPGVYGVTLTVTGPAGTDTLTRSGFVTVGRPVVAAFGVAVTQETPALTVEFTDESTGDATYWLWDFGDATTDTVQNPTHVYANPGSYTVTLVVGNSCAEDRLTLIDAVVARSISATDDGPPARFHLAQNVPNPFNPLTTISFDLARPSDVTLQVHDLQGRLVRTLLRGETVEQGRSSIVWNGKSDAGQQVAAGVYFYSIQADGFRDTRRMTLLK